MFNTLKRTLAAIVLASTAGIAAATPTPISDTVNFSPNVTLTFGTALASLTYTHDFTDNSPAYDPLVDMMTSAVLTIFLKDTGRDNGGSESFSFLIGSTGATQLFTGSNTPNGSTAYPTTLVSALATLSSTGMLDVTVTALAGSFVLEKSIVDAAFDERNPDVPGTSIDVPEPVSLGLFAIGLAGFAAARRRRQV